MLFGLGSKKNKEKAKKGQDGKGDGDGAGVSSKAAVAGSGMSKESLRDFLLRYYLYQCTTPGSQLYGNFQKLDKLDLVVDSGQTPEKVIDLLLKKYGEGPPLDWTPPQYGKKSKQEVIDDLTVLYKNYGHTPDPVKIEKQLEALHQQKRPFEAVLESVERQLQKHSSAVPESDAKTPSPQLLTPGGSPGMKQLQKQQPTVSHFERKDPAPATPIEMNLNPQNQRNNGARVVEGPPQVASGGMLFAPTGSQSSVKQQPSTPLVESVRSEQRSKLSATIAKAEKQLASTNVNPKANSVTIHEEDYMALFQEVQLLKMTIQEQVEAHKELIELQRSQQAFITEFLQRPHERANESMVRQAEVLQQQYNTALNQWDGMVGQSSRGMGYVASPMYVSTPVKREQSPRCRGVRVWLESMGLRDYAEVFEVNEIDFQSITLLGEDDLIRMGIAALGPRKAILNGISELKHQQAQESPRTRTRQRLSNPRVATTPRMTSAPAGPSLSPPKWTAHVDSKTSRVYYYNSESGESKWDLPAAREFSAEVYADLL